MIEKPKEISVKNKAIAIVTVVVVLLSCLSLFQGNRLHGAAINRIVEENDRSSDLLVDAIGTFSFGPYKARIVNLLKNNDEIVQAFSTKDRHRLYQVALPKYKALLAENKQFHVMHFHLPDGSTFLRMHWPQFYEDDLAQIRPIVQAVHQRQVQLSGYEIGRQGLFYRVIEPVFNKGEYVGALEFGIGVDQLLDAIRAQTNAEVALFVSADRWKIVTSALHDDFFPVGEYMVHTDSQKIIRQLPADFNFANSDTMIRTAENSSLIIHSHDYIKDFNGDRLGGIMAMQDITAVVSQKTIFVQRFFLFSSILLACAIFTLYIAFNKLIGSLEMSRFRLQGVVDQLRDENLARQHVEQALRESKKKSLALLENITHGIVLINSDYTISMVNNATGRIFQKDEYDFLGKHCFQQFRQRDSICPDCPGKQAMAKGGVHFLETRLLKATGDSLFVKNTAFPLPIQNNQSAGFVLVLEDVTQLLQSEKSVKKFEHIVNESQEQIAFVDSNYIHQKVNKAYLKAHGRKKEDIVGKSVIEVFGSEFFLQTMKKHVDKALSGSPVHYQYWYDYVHLGLRCMDVIYSPFMEKDGSISGIVVNSRDITRQKVIDNELRRYKDIVSASKDHMSFVDRNYVYQAVNDAYLLDFQKSREEIIGQSVISLLGGDKFASTVKEKIDLALKGKIVRYEDWFTMPRIGQSYREIQYIPFYDDNNTIAGVVVNSRDITEQKKNERYLQQVQKKEALGALASGIAHDFNNILGTIIGCTELTMLDFQEDDGNYKNLLQVRQASYRAKDLVKQILSFSRKEVEEVKAIKIIPLINETLEMIRATSPPNIDIQVSIDTDTDVMMGNDTSIQQLILNLCTNAAQSMSEKGGVLLVCLTTVDSDEIETADEKRFDQYLELSVADTGSGIEKKIWERIFDPYFTTKGVADGTGLGLAIAQNIVKNHEGMISFESTPGKGTIMRVFFPCHQQQVLADNQMLTYDGPGNGEAILIIDDEDEYGAGFR